MGLFTGVANTNFKSDKTFNEVLKLVEDSLENIGATEITEKGKITIQSKKFDNFSHEASIEGSIREKDGKYWIELNYEAKMTTIAWILILVGIFCFGIGLIVLLFPFMSKNEMKKKIEKALDDIRFDFK